ncbi:MAG: FHIPEP family type III secretion protein [Candidatus Melainabacteria bacterium]|jgi:flagellar biosynthesis protein FlhA|nr:FHIPEP family type III secretion protein [Candidatus Melainabacteria bacterium]
MPGVKISELLVGALIFGIILIIIIPLPPFLLDLYISINLTLAVIAIGISLYISKPLDFGALPTFLLLTTMFRLALNISTTRSILLNADAGKLIAAMGNFVAGGNIVVGIIIFVIITVVQFMVITKGAERVAEVSARFALDAMPGKQMSIDADFNAGLITSEQAKTKRSEVERESAFFGSMDGASKFVKGDSMAGIIITIINIVAGLTIGMAQKGLPFEVAAQKYIILTIGDAISAILPALILSIATGIIVTRAGSTADSFGQDLAKQLMARPNAFAVGAALLFIFAFLPGMPKLVLFILGFGLVAFVIYLNKEKNKANATDLDTDVEIDESVDQSGAPRATPEMMYSLLEVDKLAVWVGSGLLDIADPARNGTLVPEIASLRHQLTLNLGYILPSVRIMDAPSLSPSEYRVVIRDTTVASAEVYADKMLILREDWDNIYSEPPPGSLPGWEPALQEAAYWVDPEYLEQIDWDRPAAPAVRVITAHIAEVVRKNIDDLLEKADVRRVLDQVKQYDSQLIDNLVPGAISLGDLRRVFVNMLKERVSIRDIHYVLERLEDLTVAIKDPDQLSEKLRVSLGRQICLEFATPDRQLPAMAFHPSWETRLEQALQKVDNNMVLILEPKQIQNLVTMISNASRRILEQVERRPILICGPSLRLPLFRLIEQFDPHVHILSYAELSPDFNIQVMETIGTEMDVPAVGGR